MKNFKLLPLVLLVSTPAFANVDPKIHKLCVEAKDYLGCVKAMNGVSAHDTNRADAEKCWGEVNDKQIPLSSS